MERGEDSVDNVYYEILCKSRIVQISPGNHDLDRADNINQGLSYAASWNAVITVGAVFAGVTSEHLFRTSDRPRSKPSRPYITMFTVVFDRSSVDVTGHPINAQHDLQHQSLVNIPRKYYNSRKK